MKRHVDLGNGFARVERDRHPYWDVCFESVPGTAVYSSKMRLDNFGISTEERAAILGISKDEVQDRFRMAFLTKSIMRFDQLAIPPTKAREILGSGMNCDEFTKSSMMKYSRGSNDSSR